MPEEKARKRKNVVKSLGYLNRIDAIEYLEDITAYRFDADVRQKFLVPIILRGRAVYTRKILDQYKAQIRIQAELAQQAKAQRESSEQTGVSLDTNS